MSVVAGIGFTVSLLVTDLAFADSPETVESAKTAVLIASVLAAGLAAAVLGARSRKRVH